MKKIMILAFLLFLFGSISQSFAAPADTEMDITRYFRLPKEVTDNDPSTYRTYQYRWGGDVTLDRPITITGYKINSVNTVNAFQWQLYSNSSGNEIARFQLVGDNVKRSVGPYQVQRLYFYCLNNNGGCILKDFTIYGYAMPHSNPPKTPTGLTATDGEYQVTLKWNGNTEADIAGYKIFKDSVYLTTTEGTSYTVSNLSPKKSYRFQISAVDFWNNESPKTTEVIGNVTGPMIPDPPTLNVSDVTDSSFKVSWNSDPYAVGYSIFLNGQFVSDVTKSPYILTGLSPETVHEVTVRAKSSSGPSTESSISQDTNPLTPTGLTATAGNQTVSLSWQANAGNAIKGYYIYRNGAKVNSEPIESTSSIVSELVNGNEYNFQITAVNISGIQSPKSAIVSAKPLNPNPPLVPTGLKGSPGNQTVSLSWNANPESDVQGYFIWKDGVKLNAVPVTSTSYNVNGLTNETAYSFQVSALNTSGKESAKSAAVFIKPVDVSPPTDLRAKVLFKEGKVALTWKPPSSPVQKYNVYRNGSNIGSTTTPSLDDKAVVDGDRYTYEVSSIDAMGRESAKTPPVFVYFSKNAVEFEETDLNAPDLLKTAIGYVLLFGGILLLILTIIFAPRLIDFFFYLVQKRKDRMAAERERIRRQVYSRERREREEVYTIRGSRKELAAIKRKIQKENKRQLSAWKQFERKGRGKKNGRS